MTANDYYAFGMVEPKRGFDTSDYRYGYNTQEKTDEIAGKANHYTATHWEYDPRVVWRWNTDPKPDVSLSPYTINRDNPILYNDPEGDCPNCVTAGVGALVGGLIGGGIEIGSQLYHNGSVSDWKAVGGSTAQGAITGAAAGFTGGASLLTTAAVAGGANALGGTANRAIQGKQTTVINVVTDATIGAAFGAAGAGLNKFVSSLANNKITRNSVTSKLSNYLLNKEHPVGGSKANWFEKSLGFAQDNVDDLAKQIKFDPKTAIFQKNNGHADLYQQIIPIKGVNGKTIDVPFNWAINNGETAPKLVGAIPVKPK